MKSNKLIASGLHVLFASLMLIFQSRCLQNADKGTAAADAMILFGPPGSQ